jgi:kynurenine formamidase
MSATGVTLDLMAITDFIRMTEPIRDRTYPLWETLAELKMCHFVDLTHAFFPDIPHAPDMPKEERRILCNFSDDGFMAHRYELVGQWGTHVDPPIHCVDGGRCLDEIAVEEMLLPLVVFDITAHVLTDHDYAISVADVLAWEARNGQVPEGAFAALRTDWSKRWPDAVLMKNADDVGVRHSPGWSVSALEFLCDERGIGACGHETVDTDPGVRVSHDDFAGENFILSRDKYQIELMTNLDRIPQAGAIAVATFPKPAGGSGFPARVFAITPE